MKSLWKYLILQLGKLYRYNIFCDYKMDSIPYLKYSVTSTNKSRSANSDKSANVVIGKSIAFGDYNIAFEISNSPCDDKWIISLENTTLIGYLAFMLNDPLMLKRIFGQSIFRNKKYKVTKAMISSLLIPLVDDSIAAYYSLIELYFQNSYFKESKDDIDLLQLDIFASIRLALSFELHQGHILKQFNISIFENWKNLVDETGRDFNEMFNALLQPDNALINSVRRFQILLGTLERNIKDGLET